MVDDPSRSGCADRTGFRVDHRESGSVSVWQADRELSGTGAVGGLEWESATAGHITKQGSSMLRFLLVEAAQVTVRSLPEWRSKYFHLMMRRGRKIAKIAMARRLAICLYWMWRKGWDYEQMKKFGSHAGKLGTGDGVQ
jgi:hypothetical protein